MPTIQPLDAIDPVLVECLLDRAFGSDRHGRTAYRVRAGMQPVADMSFAALDPGGTLVGSIQCWPVALALDHGGIRPMVMVGPVAVAPERQDMGIGRALMARALAAAPADAVLMLVGDPAYYGRFGFTADATGAWRLPGPFEAHRLLARGDAAPVAAGMVGPRVMAAA